MKTSIDGKNWSTLKTIFHEDGIVIGNAAPVILNNGSILLVFCKNNLKMFTSYSHDNGESWTTPIDITNNLVLSSWKFIGSGPPSALLLSNNRIIVPCYHVLSKIFDELNWFS